MIIKSFIKQIAESQVRNSSLEWIIIYLYYSPYKIYHTYVVNNMKHQVLECLQSKGFEVRLGVEYIEIRDPNLKPLRENIEL